MAEIIDGGKTNDNGINLLLLEGGGVKGDIEVVILNNIEQLTGKPTCELFPVRGGTSVGGLIAILSGIPDPNDSHKPLLTMQEVVDLFEKMTQDIFPQELTFRKVWSLNGLLSNKFSPEPLIKLLKEYCKDYTLKDLIGDVVVTGYDLDNKENPLITFSTIDARKSEDNNYLLSDIIQGITAAPGFFPSKSLSNVTNTKHHTIIDGGVYANDPALMTWKLLEENNYKIDNAMYLSLKEESNDEYQTICCGGGIIELLKNNITGKILDATQLSDEMITQKIFGDKLIEIATYIPEEHSGMSNSSPKNLQVLKELANKSIHESSNFKNINYNENFKEIVDRVIVNYNKNNPDNKIVENDYYKELFSNVFDKNNIVDEGFGESENIESIEAKSEKQVLDLEDEGFEDDIEYEKAELLTGVKKFFEEFSEKNPDLKEDIEQFLQKAESYTLEEIKERVVNFEQASLRWQEEQAKDDMLSSCATEASQEEIKLEGEEHTDDALGYNEIMV